MLRIEPLECRALLAADLTITEFMAANVQTLLDGDGDTPDWIEIHNAGTEPVDLTGWTLTDDHHALDKWELPSRTLDPAQFMIVFASGKDLRPDHRPLTRDFHAVRTGTFVVDLPHGVYEIRATLGDAAGIRDNVAVYLQDELQATLTTAAGEFSDVTAVAEVSQSTQGQLELRLVDLGGETRKAAIDSLVITPTDGGDPWRFDFGERLSPVEPGYVQVTAADIYSAEAAYGWLWQSHVVGRDRKPHTNFKLAAGGEYLALVSPQGVVASEFGPNGTDYPRQPADISYGATPQGNRYFMHPTPGEPNGVGQTGFVADVRVGAERGFYETPFMLEITTATPAATIRYTTDGSEPTTNNGMVYLDPITISQTTTLRCAAFKTGLIPTKVATYTYLFGADVLLQDGNGLESAPWGHRVDTALQPDWEMDPEIVHHPDPDSRLVVDDLLTIPTISLAMNFEDLFGHVEADGTFTDGIYNQGESQPRATSVELINPDGSGGFQTDASVEIVGGSSTSRWISDKLSMRLKFNREFGSGDLEYPVFGAEAATSFDTLVLDAGYNNTWHHGGFGDPRERAQYLRDQYVADVQLALGGYAPHDMHVHLYLDGLYWGMYRLHERPDDNFAAAYLGGDNGDYDVVKHRPDIVTHGTNENYLKLLAATHEDLADPANYQAVLGLLDIDDFIGYMLTNFYVGNHDWDHHNWYATYNRVAADGRWRFHSWDAEVSLFGLQSDVTGRNTDGGPTGIHQRLMANPEYRLRFSDRVHKELFNDGVLTPRRAAELYQTRSDQIDRAVVAESARWGDNRREPPYTRGIEWIRERDWLLDEYFPRRTQVVLDQLAGAGIYPALAAPELSQHGGPVYASTDLRLTAPAGVIYFTTDGTDPRLSGGHPASGARRFTAPFQLAQTATVKARVLKDDQWSALTEATFVVMSELPLRITEINYQPHEANLVPGLAEQPVANDRFEFMELTNIGSNVIDLDGVRLAETEVDGDRQGVVFRFAPQTLAAGEAVVVVRDREAFSSRYGTEVRIAAGTGGGAADGQFGGKLDNDGERLTLADAQGNLVQQFSYHSSDSWPARAQGNGSSLEIIDPAGDYDARTNWRASNAYGGSPGWAGRGPRTDILINEVRSVPTGTDRDQIELFNAGADSVDVSGWYLSDDRTDRLKARIPSGTTIAAGQYVVVDTTALGIDLDETQAGALWLLAADEIGRPLRFVDEVTWEPTDVGVTVGRWPSGDAATTLLLPLANPSLGMANGPLRTGAVVISEVHYHDPLLPLLAEDFADGTAAHFTPVLGTWEVRDGGYQVTPDATQGTQDTIATITTDRPLPTDFVFSATLTGRITADFKKNAALIFDYHTPTNFKFVAMYPRAGKWRIGQRDASGWHFLAEQEVRLGIPADTEIDLTVTVQGSTVTARSGETFVGYDFEQPLAGGQVGLGSKNGASRFDHVKLEWFGGAQDLEFIELIGTTAAPVTLDGWRLGGAVDLTFPPGTQLDAGGSLVVVGFDLDTVGRETFFREAHEIQPSVVLVGPYRHNLHDMAGVVRLLRPVESEDPAQRFVLVDYVRYARQSPWPTAADGRGRSLSRAAVAAPGHVAASWSALVPTPGTVHFAAPGDLNFDGTVDRHDVDGFTVVVANPSAYQASYGVPATLVADVDGDGDVDVDDIDDFVALVVAAAPAPAGPAAHGSITHVMASGPIRNRLCGATPVERLGRQAKRRVPLVACPPVSRAAPRTGDLPTAVASSTTHWWTSHQRHPARGAPAVPRAERRARQPHPVNGRLDHRDLSAPHPPWCLLADRVLRDEWG